LLSLDSPNSTDTVTSVIYTLVASTLKFFSKDVLALDAVTPFLQEVARSLPSSSSGTSSHLFALNECVLDAIWSIETELEDKEYHSSQNPMRVDEGDAGAQGKGTGDQTTLAELVRRLIVCLSGFYMLH
jgi:hypothetical protein